MSRNALLVCLLFVSLSSWAGNAGKSDLDRAFDIGQQVQAYTDNRNTLVSEQRAALSKIGDDYDALVAKQRAELAEQKALFRIYAGDRASQAILAGKAKGPGKVAPQDLQHAARLRAELENLKAQVADASQRYKSLQTSQRQQLARLDSGKARLDAELQSLRTNYVGDQEALEQINEKFVNGQGRQTREQQLEARQQQQHEKEEAQRQKRLEPAVALVKQIHSQAEQDAALLKPGNRLEQDIVDAAVLKFEQVNLQNIVNGRDTRSYSMGSKELKAFLSGKANEDAAALTALERNHGCANASSQDCQAFRSNYLLLARLPGARDVGLVPALSEYVAAQKKQYQEAQRARAAAIADAQRERRLAAIAATLNRVVVGLLAMLGFTYWRFRQQKQKPEAAKTFKDYAMAAAAKYRLWLIGAVVALVLLPTVVLIPVAIVGAAILYYLRRHAAVREIYARIEREEAERWAGLGETPEERERAINRFFDQGTGVIRFETRLDWELDKTKRDETGHKYEYLKITRQGLGKNFLQFVARGNLSAMSTRQREWLRALELLRNWELLGDLQYDPLRAAFLFAEGVGELVSWKASAGGAGAGDSVVATYMTVNDVSEDGASVALLNRIEELMAQPHPPPVAARIRSRLMAGGGWLTPHEVPQSVFARKSDWALTIGELEGLDEPLTFSGEGAMLSVAPPGSGKTQCHVFPNLLQWKGPAIVLDVKGEIYAGTSKWRAENVGPVFKFSPLDPDNSHCFNPLTFVRREKDWIWEDSRFLADMMIVPSGASDPFWENKARDLLTAGIASICYYNPPDKRPMSHVLELMHGVDFDQMIQALKSAKDVRSMLMAGTSLEQMQAKTRDSVMQTAQASLSAWSGTRIERATRASDWNPLDLRGGKNPTIYICLKPNEVESYISLLRVFVAQHFRMLTTELPPPGAAPVLCMLDELPRLRHMPPVEEAIEIGRQYGLRLWMFVQSLGQLEKAYPNAHGMVGSCAVRIYMNPSNADGLADKLAGELGFLGAVVGDQPLTGAVLAGPEFRDYQIVLGGSSKPAKVRKLYAWQNEELEASMGSL